jgi:CelD/BcsL family acetyltransferase involved in cellulose biosynthesis
VRQSARIPQDQGTHWFETYWGIDGPLGDSWKLKMKVEIIRGTELDPGLRTHWTRIQRADAHLSSPYFCVEFTDSVASVRDDVFVGVLQSAGDVVGFFPFHRTRGGFARPVGLGLSDYHGVIIGQGVEWSPTELLKGCGLVRWTFDHGIGDQYQLRPFWTRAERSPIIATGSGLDAYIASRTALGGRQLKSIRQQISRLARDLEPHVFVEFDHDAARLREILAMKSRQCRETGAFDFFGLPWTRELVRRLHAVHSEDFSGVLSSIYVGGNCIASHFGMRSREVWHWWFPVYDKQYSRYSPGLLLLWEAIKRAAELGLHHIDLGKGLQDYKRRMMTGSIEVAEGEVTLPSFRAAAARLAGRIASTQTGRGIGRLARYPAGAMRRLQRRWRFT